MNVPLVAAGDGRGDQRTSGAVANVGGGHRGGLDCDCQWHYPQLYRYIYPTYLSVGGLKGTRQSRGLVADASSLGDDDGLRGLFGGNDTNGHGGQGSSSERETHFDLMCEKWIRILRGVSGEIEELSKSRSQQLNE